MILLLCISAMLVAHAHGASQCVCTSETRRFFYGCQGGMPIGYLYHTTVDSGCMLALPNVQTGSSYLAGIYYSKVVYVKRDYSVSVKSCPSTITRSTAKITFDQSCPPVMMNGAVLNPTTAPPTMPTTTTTTTPKPTTPTPTTPTTPSTTKKLVTVPVVTTSTKCDFQKLVTQMVSGTSAVDQTGTGRTCNGQYESEALLLYACSMPFYDPFSLIQEKRVMDHCMTMPKGEPISLFIGPIPAEISAVFWRCLPGSNSFEVLYQDCRTTLKRMDVIDTQTDKDQWFAVSF